MKVGLDFDPDADLRFGLGFSESSAQMDSRMVLQGTHDPLASMSYCSRW